MSQPLLPSLAHIAGETPSSFAARLAALHESPPRAFCSDLGMRWPFLCSGHTDQLNRLAWLTSTEIDRLRLWCPQKIGGGRFRVGRTISSAGAFRRVQIRICPRCAVDGLERAGPAGLFQLVEWSVSCLHVCEKHGVELLTLPLAKTSHETYDVVAQVLKHLPDVRAAAEADGTLSPTEFENYIRKRIWDGVQNDWLQKMDLSQLQRACLTLGVMLTRMPHNDLASLPRRMQQEACQIGFEGLSGGPARLCEHLDRLRSKVSASRPYAATDMGVFYSWLQSVRDEPALTSLAECVRNHVLEKYPITRMREVFGKPPDQVLYMTFEEARKRSGLGVSFTKRILCHLDGLPFEDAANMSEITMQDLVRVQSFWSEHYNLSQASKLLGILPGQVKDLMKLGVFRTVQFGSALRYLKRCDVHECLTELGKLPLMGFEDGFVPLRQFCQLRGIPLVKVVAEWHRGHLEGLIRSADGHGLHQIFICSNAMRNRTPTALTNDLTLLETATYLRISVISIRKLRDAGLLTQIQKRNPDTNHQRSYICQSSIRRFETCFTTLGQVSKRFNMAPIHVARRFDNDGIAPISQVNGMVRVYESHQLPSNFEAKT